MKRFKRLLRFLWPKKIETRRWMRMEKLRHLDPLNTYHQLIANCHKEAVKQDTSSNKIKDYVNPEGIIGHAHVVKGPIGDNIDIIPALARGEQDKLPKFCPRCNGLTKLSKIDKRVVACIPCQLAFMTKGAWDDPNFQAEMTHSKLGIKLRGPNDVE